MRDRGVTIVLVMHFMDEAEPLCDRVALIDKGRVGAGVTALDVQLESATREDAFVRLTGRHLHEDATPRPS